MKDIDSIAKYKCLKNGALTSIGFLGLFMLLEAFNVELPTIAPIMITFLIVDIAFNISHRLRKIKAIVLPSVCEGKV